MEDLIFKKKEIKVSECFVLQSKANAKFSLLVG